MISWFIIPGFEVPTFLVFLVGSLLFLSLGIEHLTNEMKTGGYLYIFVAFLGFLVVNNEFFSNKLFDFFFGFECNLM